MNKMVFVSMIAIVAALGCASGTQQNATPGVDEPQTEQPAKTESAADSQAQTPTEAVVETPVEPDKPQEPAGETVVEGASRFAFDFFKRLAKKEGNLFFSPLSLSTALAMTYGGARGDTEKQMAGALHFPMPQEKLHGEMFGIQSKLNGLKGVKLLVANSLWPAKKYAFKDEYLNLTKEKYSALITALDYAKSPEAARKKINKWVGEKTEKKITQLIGPGMLDALTTLVLTNAVYFKGTWTHQFDAKNTKVMPFAVSPQLSVDAPMMDQSVNLKFYADERIKIVEMPYSGDEISMFAILPQNAEDLTALESEMSIEKLDEWTEKMSSVRVHVSLPKFKIQSSFELKEVFGALGMTDAFDGLKADFSGMVDADKAKGLFISAVLHEAAVEVNEEGTEAAAATAVIMKRSMPPQFVADHPFLFLIRDAKTKSIIFMGRLTNPI